MYTQIEDKYRHEADIFPSEAFAENNSRLSSSNNSTYKIKAIFVDRIKTYSRVCHRQHFRRDCEAASFRRDKTSHHGLFLLKHVPYQTSYTCRQYVDRS